MVKSVRYQSSSDISPVLASAQLLAAKQNNLNFKALHKSMLYFGGSNQHEVEIGSTWMVLSE